MSRVVDRGERLGEPVKKVVLFGAQQIGVDFLEYLTSQSGIDVPLVVTSESTSDAQFGYASLGEKARSLEVETLDSSRADDVADRVEAAGPDIAFSTYYRRILPRRLLDVPRLGCVNIHPGSLPGYRGPTPTAWAILNGEVRFGITIHLMDEHADTGDILAQREYDIKPDETGYELHTRAMRLGAELLQENFWKIVNQELQPVTQAGAASYFGKLKSKYVIDWQEGAERIRNAVRVYAPPFTPAETQLGNKHLLIKKARVADDGGKYLLQGPGNIVDILDGDHLVVSSTDGFLVLEDYDIHPPVTDAERPQLLRVGARLQ